MMTSSNGNIFRVTGHLCGEFTGPRWIPRTKASEVRALMFSLICTRINGWVNNGEAGDLRRKRAHYDVSLMVSPNMYKSWHDHQSSASLAFAWGIHRWPQTAGNAENVSIWGRRHEW